MTGRLTAALVLVFVAGRADARTWRVGGQHPDFPLIAPAIAAAAPGDVVLVEGGVYREDLVLDKRISIVGEQHPTLFGTGAGTVITIRAGGCEVQGLTIEGSGTGETNEMDAAVQIVSSNNRIVGNTMRRVFYGVVIANGLHNEVADNVIDGLGDRPFGKRGDGIYLYRAPENFVARNTIRQERDGIYFQYAPRGRAVDNVVSEARYALHDMFSDDTRIAGNTFGGSSAGANIMNSRRITLERNRFVRNRGVAGVGLNFKESDDSVVRGNTFAENPRGLLLDGSSSNRFTDNVFRANDTAVAVFASAEQNVFSGNQFRDNWSDLLVSGGSGSTRWSADGRGNYWSRYRGFDFDGDGIGDAPHPALGAFEKLEGLNPAARIFLQSPAAAGLELAARLGNVTTTAAVDPRPLVRPPAHENGPPAPRHPATAATIAALVAVLAWTLIRETTPCSRSAV